MMRAAIFAIDTGAYKAKAESALKQLKEELVSEHKVTVTVQ